MPGVAQSFIYSLGEFAVLVRVGGIVVVEGHAKIGKVARVFGVHARNQLFRGDAFLLRAQHDGRAVGVVCAHVPALVTTQPLKAHPDVGLDVLNEVADMDRAVGVGQGAGDENAAYLLGHTI